MSPTVDHFRRLPKQYHHFKSDQEYCLGDMLLDTTSTVIVEVSVTPYVVGGRPVGVTTRSGPEG